MRILIAALLLASSAGASWAALRAYPSAAGPSSNLSTKRHGFPSGLGP